MKAILIGATGATGADVLNLVINDERFSELIVFSRRKLEQHHIKLRNHVVDFNEISSFHDLINGDVLFLCLGTTLKQAGSKQAQWKVDYTYQYEVAKAARENGVPNCILVSAAMANSNSKLFYSRMKGQLEDAILKLEFDKTLIFSPPSLIRSNSDRLGEKISVAVISFFNKVGVLKSFKPMPTHLLAKAMINRIFDTDEGVHRWENQEILHTNNMKLS